ncbi:hypothetical protein FA95DRAFT_1502488 [Auriscalpium vulgare]|uniref:Uncharacterized protein n=1 Tax=Auriscalpium vulgare TaxID=40419 RepID=A0ACB8RAK3_9AGAM|nr:hypothetical protein FA95DRAFT_1502488 [Auriscalpium vulgare]
MGNQPSLPQARGMAVASFVINFATQVYGMVSKPNMKDVADANHYAFSPHPMAIAGVFSLQVVLQALWLRELFVMRPALPDDAAGTALQHATLAYAPVYALGNLCICTMQPFRSCLTRYHTAAWLFFWLREQFWVSQAFVTVNSTIQILALALIPGLGTLPASSARAEILLHLVAKTFAGVGVLDFIDNGAVALRYSVPGGVMQGLIAGAFVLGGLYADPIMGATLVYDLLGLAIGQDGVWGTNLAWLTGTTAAVVGLKALNLFTSRGGGIGWGGGIGLTGR